MRFVHSCLEVSTEPLTSIARESWFRDYARVEPDREAKTLPHRKQKPHLASVWNIHNWDEDMTRPLTELAPKRWKVFQVLTTPEVCVCAICLENYVDPKTKCLLFANKIPTGVCVVHVKVTTKLAAQHHHDQIREASASTTTCSSVRRKTKCPTCNQVNARWRANNCPKCNQDIAGKHQEDRRTSSQPSLL